MIPPRIRRGDPIGKLVDYWNMLIDHLNESRLVPGRGVSISRMPAGTVIHTLNHAKAAGLGQAPVQKTEYNGYFTCKLLDRNDDDIKNNQVRVAVCDGETWNEENETSNNSVAKINGVSKTFKPIIVSLTRTSRQIVLRYDFSKDKAAICVVPELRDSFYTFTDYLIGEYVEVDGMYKLVQRHTSGVLILNTYANLCLAGEYADE